MIRCEDVIEHLNKTGDYVPHCCDSCHEDPDWEMASVYNGTEMVANTCCRLLDDCIELLNLRKIPHD